MDAVKFLDWARLRVLDSAKRGEAAEVALGARLRVRLSRLARGGASRCAVDGSGAAAAGARCRARG
jgi:hypothetical protein